MRQRNLIQQLRTLIFLLVFLAWACGTNSLPARGVPEAPQTIPLIKPVSLLEKNTLFTVYGRAIDEAPILGHLGTYRNFDDMAEDIRRWVTEIKKHNNNKGVVPGIHLIYAMAIPCKRKDDCLLYLEASVKDIVSTYIVPAAERGWVVVLDTQLGKSNPVQQVKRMIDKGYLKYDNVHVAIDPEFHVCQDRETPGIPIGTVEASQINEVQQMLNNYVRAEKLPTKKILIVHQFGDANVDDGVPFMIEHKKNLETCENVDLVIDMDGFGHQATKVTKYNKITDATIYPFINFRGIKIFYPSRWEKHGHYDKPPMTMDQVFGLKPVQGKARMQTKPNVIIIA